MLQLIVFAAVTDAQRDFLALLYEEYRIPMWRYAHAITGSPETADDVVQTAFVALLDKIELLESLHLRQRDAYIAVTVRHLAVKCNQMPESLTVDDQELSTGDDHVYGQALDRDQIGRAARQLPERYQAVILLRYGLDQTHEQIGAVLGITPGNVRVRLHRALQQLRKLLREDDHG